MPQNAIDVGLLCPAQDMAPAQRTYERSRLGTLLGTMIVRCLGWEGKAERSRFALGIGDSVHRHDDILL